jgi:REP element-mobilizing transposase RayT
VTHHGRDRVRNQPVHVTLRCRDEVPALRSSAAADAIARAITTLHARAAERQGDLFAASALQPFFRVTHYSVQATHIHLIVEASDGSMLSRGMNALSSLLAKRLNCALGRTGPVFSDRYHAHVLRTPTETSNAVRYAVHNALSHARRGGDLVDPEWRDPYSSEAVKQLPSPRTWLLKRAASVRR